jgi:hypothetical protein
MWTILWSCGSSELPTKAITLLIRVTWLSTLDQSGISAHWLFPSLSDNFKSAKVKIIMLLKCLKTGLN